MYVLIQMYVMEQMCRKILDAGIMGIHMYTLNLERSAVAILEALGLINKQKVRARAVSECASFHAYVSSIEIYQKMRTQRHWFPFPLWRCLTLSPSLLSLSLSLSLSLCLSDDGLHAYGTLHVRSEVRLACLPGLSPCLMWQRVSFLGRGTLCCDRCLFLMSTRGHVNVSRLGSLSVLV
jgi:hypothetical protein